MELMLAFSCFDAVGYGRSLVRDDRFAAHRDPMTARSVFLIRQCRMADATADDERELNALPESWERAVASDCRGAIVKAALNWRLSWKAV